MIQSTPKAGYNLLTYAAYTRLKQLGPDNWHLLSKDDQELAALWMLEREIYDGGFVSFFCTAGEKWLSFVVRALKKMQAKECLSVLTQLNTILESIKSVVSEFNPLDFLSYLTDEEREMVDSLTLLYWNNADQLNEKIYRVYKAAPR